MKTSLNKKSGFSLVEMLVVIAVIGIIAAIAVPMIGNITGKAEENATRRNAQNIASVYSAAVAAGYSGASDLATAVDSVTTGNGVQGTGSFAGTYFFVPNVPADDTTTFKTANNAFLEWNATADVLEYK
ncbi:MAG: prepilin-type N-terminal cleavage/methylation domain-containing protein [Verrucomicrobiota bacterium]